MPISAFPCLKKVPVKERNSWYLMGGGVSWDSCPAAVRCSLSAYGNPDRYGYTQFCYPVNQYTEAQKPSLFKVRQVAENRPIEGL